MQNISKKYKIQCILLGLILLMGCEDQISWDLEIKDSYMVVDALITSEIKQQEIYVYSASGKLNGSSVLVNDAELFFWDGSKLIDFKSTGNQGLYISEPFGVTVDKTYALIIRYGNFADTAFAELEPITPFKNDTVYFSDGLYRFIYRGSDLPAFTDVYYDWTVNSAYCNSYGSCTAKSTFYTLNNIDVAEEFGPEKQEIWFPSGTTLIRKKYSLSSSHQNFIRSLLIETQWRGGLFDTEQGNVPTNFINGTRGWFGVCMVLTDTTIVE